MVDYFWWLFLWWMESRQEFENAGSNKAQILLGSAELRGGEVVSHPERRSELQIGLLIGILRGCETNVQLLTASRVGFQTNKKKRSLG